MAIETSGRLGSVALVEHGKVLIEQSFPHGLKHAAGLLPLVDEMMRKIEWKPLDLKELYVSSGPGSFTGLRIGVTLAKTLSFVTGARIVPVPSLQVLAYNAPSEAAHVVVVLDAKRDQVFTARYELSNRDWIEKEPAQLDSLTNMIARAPKPVYLLGEGIPYHAKFIPADPSSIVVTSEACWNARASIVARLGVGLAGLGSFVSAEDFLPTYVRIPEAEEKYNLQHSQSSPQP